MATILSTYSKKELQKKLKNQKRMLVIKVIIVVLMVVFSIFFSIENKISFLSFLPFFFIPMTIYMYIEMKKIKKELASRK